MRLLGQLKSGMPDDFDGVHPEILSRYYGADRSERTLPPGQTGAGHSDDEDEEEVTGELDQLLSADQNRHIRHEAIPVPPGDHPFHSMATLEAFLTALSTVRAAKVVPANYGLLEAEWPACTYGDAEFIRLGRGRRRISVQLPFLIWWPRAVEWAQGVEIMTELLMIENDEM